MPTFAFALQRNGERLELAALHHPKYGSICADWCSAEVRRRIAAGEDWSALVPPLVARYIREQGLYGCR